MKVYRCIVHGLRFFSTTFFILSIFLVCLVNANADYGYEWVSDETYEGQESATIIKPIQVIILDEQVEVPPHSASIDLMEKYSVHLKGEWSHRDAYRLLQTFDSIPQPSNYLGNQPSVPASVWMLSNQHIHNDIMIEHKGEVRLVKVSTQAFIHATPLLAEIEGVRGKYFSKRLHHAVVRYVTDNGWDRGAVERILQGRYGVSTQHIDYVELTRGTTSEHAGRFSDFKNEELMAIISMFEELPSGMHITPGLKYLVRRLDGTPHPRYPDAPAVAWGYAGYIEFMDSAFKGESLDYTHRLILHEKAHFLWDYLFDEQLKQDWIELGGWYENPDAKSGWSTTKEVEFVSSYAHAKNPNEDMAESISFYIVRPDKLRSRSPAKYQFIQDRIMHGTRYISHIREDLTFEVYNLYPDYVYPGKIIRVGIQVVGEPEEDKLITVELEIHSESDLDTAHSAFCHVISNKGTSFPLGLHAVDDSGQRINAGHILRSAPVQVSKYAASGYWTPENIYLTDGNKNSRMVGFTKFGWKLYIDNPLSDCKPPEYVPDSVRLSLSNGDENGRPYQIINVSWKYVEDSYIDKVGAYVNDTIRETHARGSVGVFDDATGTASVDLMIPDYMPDGIYRLVYVNMRDVAGNEGAIYFTRQTPWYVPEEQLPNEESPPTIEVKTKNPDLTPPVLDLNNITVRAEPTRPEDPNGETYVYISFKVKDDISGFDSCHIGLTDPQGIGHSFWFWHKDSRYLYFQGDPTAWETRNETIYLPVGSVPGIWGVNEITVFDKASNKATSDFTEIVRFEVGEESSYSKYDLNNDGIINILDLVIVSKVFRTQDAKGDVNNDGKVNILDLVEIANKFE